MCHPRIPCRPFAPFKELGSWQGCVVCWSGERLERFAALAPHIDRLCEPLRSLILLPCVCRRGVHTCALICFPLSLPSDDDPTRLLPCDTCDCKHHSYCLEPPLEEPPLQTVSLLKIC